jgi:hypothetical protein
VRVWIAITCIAILAPFTVSAITQELESYRGENRVIIVYARSADDPRAFQFNLALSEFWLEVERYELVIIDVIPGIYDVDIVADALDIRQYDFAVLLVDLDGSIVRVSSDPESARELLDLVLQLEESS